LINRRHYLPRLLLILSSKKQMQKPPQRFEDVDRVTPYQGRVAASLDRKRLGAQFWGGAESRSEAFSIRPHAPLARHQA
ncbi:MAG: hypothetical protein WCA27_02825, partial [Candidatus Sulfotelmatobacter sp.]